MDSFKKVLLPILLVIIFIVVAGIFYRKNQGLSPLPFPNTQNTQATETKTVTINGTSIKVEVADSDQEKQKGLSQRASLNKNSGMLFEITDSKKTPTFWMKDMKFPIDIIWILSSSDDVNNGKIIQIDKGIEPSPQGTSDKELKLYSPKSAVDYVLEVNSGYSDLNNIKVGDSVLIE